MTESIDFYAQWLGIKETARPLNHYQLLRLKKFEDDPAKIRQHYRKLNGHVRKFGSGEFAQASQDLLNELARAMLCLTDARRKGEYDAGLGRTDAGEGRRRTLEEILLARQSVDPEKLAKARNYAKAVGVEVRDALLQQKLAPADQVVAAYAESIGLPYIDLKDIDFDALLGKRVPAIIARQHSCVPVMIDDNQLLMACPNLIDPHVEEELRLRLGLAVRTVLCTPGDINEVVAKYYTREDAETERADGLMRTTTDAEDSTTSKKQQRLAAAPLTAEDRKRLLSIAAITFNFSFMAWQMVTQMGYLLTAGWGTFFMGFPIAGAIAGVTWAVMKATGK